MKYLILWLSITFSFLGFSQTYQGDLKTVLNNIHAQELAWNKGDVDGFMSFYWNNDSLMFIGKKGITYGWKSTNENYKKSYPTKEDMGKLIFEIVKMEQFNKTTVYVIGKWQLEKEKPVGGYFTLIWRKINGKWFIISDHTS